MVGQQEQTKLSKDLFKLEDLPDVKPYQAEARTINGQTYTCFSPADSRELAIELMDYRTRLKKQNKRMETIYYEYFHEKMP